MRDDDEGKFIVVRWSLRAFTLCKKKIERFIDFMLIFYYFRSLHVDLKSISFLTNLWLKLYQ